jgi:hypothetical protein
MKMKTGPTRNYGTAKAVLRGKCITMNAYIKRTERSQINDLMLHMKLQGKEEQAKPKTSRRREIVKIKHEINDIETKKCIQTTHKTKSWLFEKINKIYRLLVNLTKMRREKAQISKIRNAKEEITTNTTESQGIIRDYFENLYSNKFQNLEEIDKFPDTYDHAKLNQEDINHQNRSVTQKEVEATIKCFPKKKSQGSDGFSAEF